MSARRLALFAATAASFVPAIAHAHLVSTGMGPVYDGIGHLLLTPEDLVPAIALAMYAGLRGAAAGRRAMFLVPVAWLAGGIAGAALRIAPSFPVAAISFLVIGALVAADVLLPTAAVTTLVIAFGLAHGYLNGAALANGPGTLALLGITSMLFVLVTVASAVVVSLHRPPARIAVRVAGSWVAAVGLLMIGWAMKVK